MGGIIPAASLRAEIGVDGEEAATAKVVGFGDTIERTSVKATTSFGRIGVAARAADTQLARFGVPFSGTAGTVITSLEGIERRGTSLGGTLSNLGRAEATAAVVGLAAVATEGVHLADNLELSQARLQTAVKNSGQQWDAVSGQIGTTDKTMEKLGFTNADTESSLARLEQRTHDVTKAQQLEQIAANTAAGTHKDLATATSLVVQIDAGRYTQLSRLGLATKDQIKGFHDSADAVAFLANIERGQAAAATDTFAGKMKVLSAETTDLGATIGVALVPKIEDAAQAALTGVHDFQGFNAATAGMAGKALAVAAALPIAAFAMDKLGSASVKVGTALDGAVAGIGRFATGNVDAARSVTVSLTAVSTESETAAVASARLTVAQDAQQQATVRSAAANSEYDAAMAEYVTATDGGVVAAQRLVVAEREATAALEAQVTAAQSAAAAQSEAAGTTATARGAGIFASIGAALPQIAGTVLAVRELDIQTNHLIGTTGQSAQQTDRFAASLKNVAATGTETSALIQKFGADYTGLAHSMDQARASETGVTGVLKKFDDFFGGDPTDKYSRPVKDLTKSLEQLYKTDPAGAIEAFQNIKAHLIADGETAGQVDKTFKGLEGTIAGLAGPVDKTTLAQTKLNDATAKYSNDILTHQPGSVLAADYSKVSAASGIVAGAQNKVNAAVEAGAGALGGAGDAATNASYAYLGLGSAALTASGALAAIQAKETGKGSPYKLQIDTSAAHAAIDAFNGKADSIGAGGGGGGAGQTATAAALDQTQKELTLHDALRSVGTATTGVTQAQHGLTSARQQATDANAALTTAETNYKNVLNGVAANSRIALAAQTALTQARRDAASQALSVQDAERSLALARSDNRLSAFGVTDAQTTLTASQAAAATANAGVTTAETQLAAVRANSASTATDVSNAETALDTARTAASAANEQVTKDEVALDDARINSKTGTENITKAELDLGNQRATAKQKTQDLNAAQRTYTDTLDGFPKHSKEAQQATHDLTTAQGAARSAADGVVTATQAIVTAQGQIPTSVLGVERAQADLDGKLTAAAGSGGGMAKLMTQSGDMITKLEAVRGAFQTLADDAAANVTRATQSAGKGILREIQALEFAVAAEPLLQSAFAGELADLNAMYQKWLYQQPLTPITGHGGIGTTPNSPTHGTGGGVGDATAFNIPTHAAGGYIPPGGTSTVGEAGFEIIQPRVGGGVDVLSNPQSRHALSSGSNGDGALLAAVNRLNDTLSKLRTGVHVDTIIARDAEDTMRKIDQQQKRQYLLANL